MTIRRRGNMDSFLFSSTIAALSMITCHSSNSVHDASVLPLLITITCIAWAFMDSIRLPDNYATPPRITYCVDAKTFTSQLYQVINSARSYPTRHDNFCYLIMVIIILSYNLMSNPYFLHLEHHKFIIVGLSSHCCVI